MAEIKFLEGDRFGHLCGDGLPFIPYPPVTPVVKFDLELTPPFIDLFLNGPAQPAPSDTAKPFWVFAGPYYYASGGLQNLRGRYDTQQAAVAALVEMGSQSHGEDEWQWYQIVDARSCELLRHYHGGGYKSEYHYESYPAPEGAKEIYDWPDCVVVVPEDTEENNLLEVKS